MSTRGQSLHRDPRPRYSYHASWQKKTSETIHERSLLVASAMRHTCSQVSGTWPASTTSHSAGSMPAAAAASSTDRPSSRRTLRRRSPNISPQTRRRKGVVWREAGNDQIDALIYSLLLIRRPVKRDCLDWTYIMSMYSVEAPAKGSIENSDESGGPGRGPQGLPPRPDQAAARRLPQIAADRPLLLHQKA